MDDWRTRLAAARLWAVDRSPYLAMALFALRPVETPGLSTVAVDRGWRLYVDPTAVGGWTVSELGSILVHEVGHVLRDHATRSAAATDDHRLFNLAADAEINDDLEDLDLPSPVTPELLGLARGQLAETYLLGIAAGGGRRTGRPFGRRPAPLPSVDCGSGADGHPRPWELPHDDPTAPAIEGIDVELLREAVARDVRADGGAPGGLRRWAESLLSPLVDWREVLASRLRHGSAQVAGNADFSYSRPSRRTTTATPRVLAPSLVRPVHRVAVVLDTSGSMGADDLARAVSEVGGVVASTAGATGPVPVLACDSAVRAVTWATSASRLDVRGGGGTDMGEGLAAAADLRPRPHVVVVLTDGWTPWPDAPPRGIDVIAAVIGTEATAPDWATTVAVEL